MAAETPLWTGGVLVRAMEQTDRRTDGRIATLFNVRREHKNYQGTRRDSWQFFFKITPSATVHRLCQLALEFYTSK